MMAEKQSKSMPPAFGLFLFWLPSHHQHLTGMKSAKGEGEGEKRQ
jgi:hypothetical protein